MKIAAGMMLLLALLLAALAFWRGGPSLVVEGLRVGMRGTIQLLPVLVVVFLLTGFVEVLLPRDVVARWLTDAAGVRGLGVAWLAGILTPGGGPVGLPIAAALMRAGAGGGVIVTYLTSMALLSFIRVPLELGIYGGRLTALRIGSSVMLPFLAGFLAQQLARVGGP